MDSEVHSAAGLILGVLVLQLALGAFDGLSFSETGKATLNPQTL